jgi:hypothetical protein
MAHASLTPAHLKGASQNEAVANCFRVANQALRWGFDPFAIMDETYVVHGRLGYQGKLVAAVVNARAGLKDRLRYEHTGTGADRTVTVSGQFKDENEPRTITLSIKQALTDNKMWKTDPDQKLVYSGVTKWARRHCPEIMLGVLTDDDVDAIAQRAQETDTRPLGGIDFRRKRELEPETSVEPQGPGEVSQADTVNAAVRDGIKKEQSAEPSAPASGASYPLEFWAQSVVMEIDSKIDRATSGGDLIGVGAQLDQHQEHLGPHYDRLMGKLQAVMAEYDKRPAATGKKK